MKSAAYTIVGILMFWWVSSDLLADMSSHISPLATFVFAGFLTTITVETGDLIITTTIKMINAARAALGRLAGSR